MLKLCMTFNALINILNVEKMNVGRPTSSRRTAAQLSYLKIYKKNICYKCTRFFVDISSYSADCLVNQIILLPLLIWDPNNFSCSRKLKK